MKTHESNSATDYIYYPIVYPTMAFTTVAIINFVAYKDWSTWVVMTDKAKFIDGIGVDNYSRRSSNDLNILSVGF